MQRSLLTIANHLSHDDSVGRFRGIVVCICSLLRQNNHILTSYITTSQITTNHSLQGTWQDRQWHLLSLTSTRCM